jgi:hypothetical protein
LNQAIPARSGDAHRSATIAPVVTRGAPDPVRPLGFTPWWPSGGPTRSRKGSRGKTHFACGFNRIHPFGRSTEIFLFRFFGNCV